MIDAKKVKENVNKRVEKLYHRTDEGLCWPYVCIICDEFLKPKEVKTISEEELEEAKYILSPSHWNPVGMVIAKHYSRRGSSMLLSPRAVIVKQKDKRKKDGYSCCNKCLCSLHQGEMPRFAIANNYAFGEPPDCLTKLTQVELALLTPVKTYGYCFTYTGGKNMKMKGSLTYFKVKMEAITRAVMHCDVLGMHKNVVVLLHGKMTPKQRQVARLKNKIRVKYVIRALKWLLRNHAEWKKRDIDLKEFRKRLRNPILVDNSTLEEGCGDNNVESMESFKVFFPDGTMSSTNGGQENIEEFKKLVQKAKCNGFNLEVQIDLERKICADYKDSNLVNACLLQFPYGRGGIHEIRKKGKGSYGNKTYIEDYVAHLTKLSQPQFHTDLFTLILYNMAMKNTMVKSASWKVRDRGNAAVFAQELSMEDITLAINRKESGRIDGSGSAGNKFVSAVDAVTRDIPHTNAASRRGRGDAEAMQHSFGMPHVFLTVNPDDADNFLVQVLTGEEIDDDEPVSSLSEEELHERMKLRNELRIKYPGVCAYFYDCILEIVIEEVIGWDLQTNTARAEGGLFGIAKAFTSSTEEQGRTSLHSHFLIWITSVEKGRKRLYSGSKMEQHQAEKELSIFVDKISTCSLFRKTILRRTVVGRLFPHECKVDKSERELPKVVDGQNLRYLRHRIGEMHYRGRFADCVHCGHRWNNTELVESYLLNGERLQGVREFPNRKRLRAMTVEYQKSPPGTAEPPNVLVEAAYNHHMHAGKACFSNNQNEHKKTTDGKKRKRRPQFGTECRYRYPQPASKAQRSCIRNALEIPIQWYNWDGTFSSMPIKEVIVKRHSFDGFQNVSCPAISHSKICCNTNVALIMPGPIGQYTFKYNMKATQDQETEEYGRVKEAMQKMLSQLKKDASDASIAIQRVLSATFAHQKINVVGGAMASHLTRKQSRFIFSHKTVWCPLKDLKDLLNGRKVGALLNTSVNQSPFYICSALHYLCRPTQLEDLNVHDFFSTYEVVRANSSNRDSLLWPYNHLFNHPSYQASSKTFCQGVKEREKKLLPKVLQSQFPDTAQFGGSLLDNATIINAPMEMYSEQVLLLFHPFRTLDDLDHPSGSYTRKLREIVAVGQLSEKSKEFLQNLIDAKANCFRAGRPKDPLERATTPFMPADAAFDQEHNEEEDDDDSQDLEGAELDALLQLIGEHPDQNSSDEIEGCVLPESLDLSLVRNKGYHDAGYEHIAKINCRKEPGTKAFECSHLETNAQRAEEEADDGEVTLKEPKKKDLVSILINKCSRRTYSFADIIKGSTPIRLMRANGSVESILDWAEKAKLDNKQRRAFEIITGSFILSFFNDVKNQTMLRNNDMFLNEKKLLQKLVQMRKRGTQQLICVLHGPGGCGKTTAIDLVVAYSKEYCSYMKNYEFSSRTIVITAMTGVAATLLLGETTHKALYLNQKLPIATEQVIAWEGTKLLIVDEISFASKEDFAKIHARLQTLKQQIQGAYGGLDVIFSGDFRQLEPVGEKKKPVYEEHCPEFKLWTNCFIELEGMHRFKNDLQHGERLRRFRDGKATAEDIVHLNKRVVTKGEELPEDIRYATYFNRDRDSINAALFEERCMRTFTENGNTDDTIMIFSDTLRKRISNQVYVPYKKCQHFWENCGEDHCKIGSFESRIDPVLRLFTGCRVLLPDNSDVKEGLANGTQAFFEKTVLKPGVQPRSVKVGNIAINAVFASEVEHVVLRHQNDRIEPQTFHLKGKKHTFKAAILLPEEHQTKRTVREGLRMTAFQIPMLINNATTGHKLQGSGVDNIFVHNWSYVQNWPYVMLSRVKTENGLYMRRPLRRNLSHYAVPDALLKMLKSLRTKAPSYWTDAEYKKKFGVKHRQTRN